MIVISTWKTLAAVLTHESDLPVKALSLSARRVTNVGLYTSFRLVVFTCEDDDYFSVVVIIIFSCTGDIVSEFSCKDGNCIDQQSK